MSTTERTRPHSTAPARPAAAAPRLPADMVERTELIEAWLPHRHRRCHVVLGPAGSGKTTLALQWRARLSPLGFHAAWLSMHRGEPPQALARRLIAACPQSPPLEEAQAGAASAFPSPGMLAAAMLRAFAHQGHDVMLLIDDYQNVADPQVHELFQTLLDYAPANLHLLILSRTELPLSLLRLATSGQLHLIDGQRLRFTRAETSQLVGRHAPALPPHGLARLQALTDGWAVGIRMLVQAAQRRHADSRAPLRITTQIATYLQRELLSHLPAALLHALVRLSPARHFNEALVARLLGVDILERLSTLLQRERLLITATTRAGGETWWQFHPLLHELLLTRFAQMPAESQQRARQGLGAWFAQRGMLDDAARLLIAAGEPEAAADWIEAHAGSLFFRGELQALVRALSVLPPELLARRPALRLWDAWSLLCHRRFDACARSLAELERGADGQSPRQRYLLRMLKVSLAIQRDDLAAVAQDVPGLRETAGIDDAVLLGGRRNLVAWSLLQQGRPEEARRHLAGPMLVSDDGTPLRDSPFGSQMSSVILGATHLHEGDCRQAEAVLNASLEQSVATLGEQSLSACIAAGTLCEVRVETGDVEGARSLAARYLQMLEKLAYPDALLSATLALARLQVLAGDFDEALAVLDALAELPTVRGMPRIGARLCLEAFGTCLHARREKEAGARLAALEALARQAHAVAHHGAATIARWTELAQAQWHLHRLQDAKAGDLIGALEADAALDGRLRFQAGALAAVILRRGGRERMAARRTLELVQQARALGLFASLVAQGPEFVDLLRELARCVPADDPMLALFLERVLAQVPAAPSFAVPARARHEAPSRRERQVFALLMHDLSNRRIAEALGVSVETVRWHLKNIYLKLEVRGRRDAIAAVRRLGIDPDPRHEDLR